MISYKLKAAEGGSTVTPGRSRARSLTASVVSFASDSLSSLWDRRKTSLETPWQRWWRSCWDANPGSALPAFVTFNPDTLTAGQTPTGTVLQLDPADGKDLAKSPCHKALLQGGEF